MKQTLSDFETNSSGKINCKHKFKLKETHSSNLHPGQPLAASGRLEVSTVTSSGMMSPRVSSTVHENSINGKNFSLLLIDMCAKINGLFLLCYTN